MQDIPPTISDSDWQQTPPSVRALVSHLLQRLEHQEQVAEQQAARIVALETELARRKGHGSGGAKAAASSSGTTSSRTKRTQRRSGRSKGGQPGHEGHGRCFVAADQANKTLPIRPTVCQGCGHPLTGDDPHPQRHQQVVIPPVQAHVIEYQLHTLRCAHCDTLTQAAWPDGVPRRTFGPSVQAWVGLLSGAYRMSKRNIAALLWDAFGVQMSPGTVSQLEQEVSAAVAEPVDQACDYVRRQPSANLDETGWWQGKVRHWLWAAITAGVSVFRIRPSRGREVVDEILGDSMAIIGSDRYSAYGHLPLDRRQVCWAHLRRTFEDFLAREGEAACVGEKLLACTGKLFQWLKKVRDGTLQHASLLRYVHDLRPEVHYWLWYGQQFGDAPTAATCGNLLQVESALWTFVDHEGVDPTNNVAERGLRHAVLWRHTSFGTQSAEGSRFVERMLTVHDTLRQQQRDILAYLTEACQAPLHRRAAPSLLPAASSPNGQ